MLKESLALALDSFRSNKLRSALSLIGMVIGVASVVAVTAIASSGTAFIKNQYAQFANNVILVFPGWDRGTGRPVIDFDDRLMTDIRASLPLAAAVLPRVRFGSELSVGRSRANAQLSAVFSRYIPSMGAGIDSGRGFDPVDEYREKPVVILGSVLAASLFPEGNPVGKYVTARIGGGSFRLEVIGVLLPKGSFTEDWDRSAYITFDFMKGKVSRDTQIDSLTVLAVADDKLIQLGKDIERFFLERTGNPEAVDVLSPLEWAENDKKITGTISMLLTGIAAISLLVGGIGIMNIMLVSVTERTREIGIRKALGATPRHIRSQFLVETTALTLTGGVIGLILGNGIGWIAVKGFHWEFVASPTTAVLAFLISGATGIFFGLYPATRAARLDPVEALASE